MSMKAIVTFTNELHLPEIELEGPWTVKHIEATKRAFNKAYRKYRRSQTNLLRKEEQTNAVQEEGNEAEEVEDDNVVITT